MEGQIKVQNLLRHKFEKARVRNPLFSQRAFCRSLGLSPGEMSELMRGRRLISRQKVERILSRLAVDPTEQADILQHFPNKRTVIAGQVTVLELQSLQLTSDQFHIIGDWYHFGILSLMGLPDFRSETEWIAARLNITKKEAAAAMTRLLRLGLVRRQGRKWVKSKNGLVRTTDDVTDLSLKRAHRQYLEKATCALDEFATNERDFSGVMVAMDPKKLQQAKIMIREFQDRFLAEMEVNPGSEVFQLYMQFFPLTKNLNSKKNRRSHE